MRPSCRSLNFTGLCSPRSQSVTNPLGALAELGGRTWTPRGSPGDRGLALPVHTHPSPQLPQGGRAELPQLLQTGRPRAVLAFRQTGLAHVIGFKCEADF